MFKKVLILSASSGAGHVRAAQAIEAAIVEMGAAAEVRHVDVLQYTNALFKNLYSKAYVDMVNRMPDVLGLLYDALDRPWSHERRRLAFDKLNSGPFVKLLRDYQPDITVCTHFLPCEIISWLKEKERFSAPQAIVVTDLDLHAMWLCRYYEHYFVALDETKVHLEKLGIAPDRVSVTGIPVHPAFASPLPKAEARQMLGLPQGLPVLLLSAGGYGVGPIKNILMELLQMKTPAHVVALCGRNEQLKEELQHISDKVSPRYHVGVHPVGFTNEIHHYMAAADLLVGKAGGLTTSEALASGLGIIVVNPIPGQEERNSDHLLEEGVALRCNNLPALSFKIDRLLSDPQRMSTMNANVLRFGRPRAAYDIVEELLRIRPLSAPNLTSSKKK